MDDQPPDNASIRSLALSVALRATVGKLKRKLLAQADVGDLTNSQVAVLLRLERDGPATTSSLARAEGMRPQSMASIVAALDAAGLVGGSADPADGRQTLLSLTDACRQWLRESRAARQDWLSRTIEARLSASELAQLETAVALLSRLADD